MRLIHTVSHVDEEATGPSYTVPSLCSALTAQGNSVKLFTLARGDRAPSGEFQHQSFPQSFGPRKLGPSRMLHDALTSAAKTTDLFHTHGLWMMPNIYPAWAAKRYGKPFVVSPRGMLGLVPLTYSRWKKKLFWMAAQGNAVRYASLIHATSMQEYEEVRAFGVRQPVAIIPNGIDIPVAPFLHEANKTRFSILYLGRLHKKKGLEILLTSWSRIEGRFPNWNLRIVGVGEEPYVSSLKKLGAELRLTRVVFAGPRYGAEKRAEYLKADLFILPSLNENFAMTVAEAMASGVPVIATTGTPWADLEAKKAGWCVTPEPAALEGALIRALNTNPTELREMGKRGVRWMQTDFSWTTIGIQMEATYLWLLGQGPMPACVRLV